MLALSQFSAMYGEWQNQSSGLIAQALGLPFPYTKSSTSVFIFDCGLVAQQLGLANQADDKEIGLCCQIAPLNQVGLPLRHKNILNGQERNTTQSMSTPSHCRIVDPWLALKGEGTSFTCF